MRNLTDAMLDTWSFLNSNIHELSEEQCLELLNKEKKSLRRVSFMIRLYGRYNKLRSYRERQELFNGVKS